MSYISYPIASTPADILAEAYAFIKTKIPTWHENDANLDTWILQTMASQASDLRTLSSDVPDTIFRYFGATIMGLPPLDAASAVVHSTWTMKDNAGYTVPAGTYVSIRDDSGNQIPFMTQVDVIVPGGTVATAAGAVTLVAVSPGAAASGIGGAAVDASLIDTLDFVASVVLTEASYGGQDAETASDYNDRLARRMRRLSTRPILPADFADMMLDVTGVYRAVAIDGYNPADDSYGNERMVTVAGVDQAGAGIGAGVKTDAVNYLEANREVNFIINSMDPHVNLIDVTTQVKAVPGYDHATLQTAVEGVINDFLSPATWARDPAFTDSTTGDQTWVDTTVLRYNKMLQALSGVEGVDYVVTLDIGIHGGAMGAVDVALVGPASLTTPDTITVTVT